MHGVLHERVFLYFGCGARAMEFVLTATESDAGGRHRIPSIDVSGLREFESPEVPNGGVLPPWAIWHQQYPGSAGLDSAQSTNRALMGTRHF